MGPVSLEGPRKSVGGGMDLPPGQKCVGEGTVSRRIPGAHLERSGAKRIVLVAGVRGGCEMSHKEMDPPVEEPTLKPPRSRDYRQNQTMFNKNVIKMHAC